MILYRSFLRLSGSLFNTTKCAVYIRNGWTAELYFGSKVEVPSPPKRPLTAYMIFCKENRKNILKENPSLSSPEQIKILAEKWGHLTRDMKKPYEISARESTLLYGELHKRFYENLTEEQKEELVRLKMKKRESRRLFKLRKALRDSGVPKPPTSAYGLFVQSEAKNKSNVKPPSDFIKNVAETWKNLSEDAKKVFEDQSQSEKKRYALELSEWRSRMLAEGRTELIMAFEGSKGGRKKLLLDHLEDSSKKKASSDPSRNETPKS